MLIRVVDKYDELIDEAFKSVRRELIEYGVDRRVKEKLLKLIEGAHEVLLHAKTYHIVIVYDDEIDLLKVYRLSTTRVVAARKYVDLVLKIKVTGEVEARVIDGEVADAVKEGYVHRTIITRSSYTCTCESYRFRGYCKDAIIALTLYKYVYMLRGRHLSLKTLPVVKYIVSRLSRG